VVSQQVGVWEFDPRSGRLDWSFPTGVALEDLPAGDLERLLRTFRTAASLQAPASVAEEFHIGESDIDGGRWIAVYGRRLPASAAGLKVMGVVLDVSEQKGRARQDHLAINEMNHRMRNAVAVVQAMAFQTLRHADSLAEAREALHHRLTAMGRSETLLDEANWGQATVGSVIEASLASHATGGRVEMAGPAAALESGAARGLSMIIHELSTNALKYGALSNDLGHVRVAWSRMGKGDLIGLEWRETGGPLVRKPERQGFGWILIHSALSAQRTQVDLTFCEAGVSCLISGIPLQAPG
jgi:two-component sensor histidine kinase